ncbi:MAG: bifunctional phosphoribosylaminoimidazolecarboxamide formyltransferase/IMP cyclohydrolase [Actinobacteria bacterium]|nr:bifunctional phosphoribosylaminoimidazolecarboxamide formyltransferase/IMP cyclohydrolase [Actinomycetota bacterium]
MRALLSVSDKTGITELAKRLTELGWEIVASGGTSEVLLRAGIPHLTVEEVTGAAEFLDGRVKTLHPVIHGAILADRSNQAHLEELAHRGITPIDLVVCNLYPFRAEPSIEMIDIGGPTMLRAAAKNYLHVAVVVNPDDYGWLLEELARGGLSEDTRRRLARAAYAHTAAYDAAIVSWFDSGGAGGEGLLLPPTIHLALEKTKGTLRYGENPHQQGALYKIQGTTGWWESVVQLAGKEMSYLNYFDAEAAWRLVWELTYSLALMEGPLEQGEGMAQSPAVAVIIKHANAAGTGVAEDLATAYRRALECDPISAFGGVVALNRSVTPPVAEAIVEGPQADVIVAPSFDAASVDRLVSKRKATRLVEATIPYPIGIDQGSYLEGNNPSVVVPSGVSSSFALLPGGGRLGYRSIDGGFLVQELDSYKSKRASWTVATKLSPTKEQWKDLELAWMVCARTTSNAIVIARDGQTVGVGAGQQSRVEAAEIAVKKAASRAVGGVAASDAFFPFSDGLLVLAEAGVRAVIQPGGSVRDAEVIAAADERGVAMVMTHERHFRH